MLDSSVVYCRGPHNVDGLFLPQFSNVWEHNRLKSDLKAALPLSRKMLMIGLPRTFVEAQICHIPICVFLCDISNNSFS